MKTNIAKQQCTNCGLSCRRGDQNGTHRELACVDIPSNLNQHGKNTLRQMGRPTHSSSSSLSKAGGTKSSTSSIMTGPTGQSSTSLSRTLTKNTIWAESSSQRIYKDHFDPTGAAPPKLDKIEQKSTFVIKNLTELRFLIKNHCFLIKINVFEQKSMVLIKNRFFLIKNNVFEQTNVFLSKHLCF